MMPFKIALNPERSKKLPIFITLDLQRCPDGSSCKFFRKLENISRDSAVPVRIVRRAVAVMDYDIEPAFRKVADKERLRFIFFFLQNFTWPLKTSSQDFDSFQLLSNACC